MTTCGHQWRGRDACPDEVRADAPHTCINLRHYSQPCRCSCGEADELYPHVMIMVGQNWVHTRCRDLRTNGQPDEICDRCRLHLMGSATRSTP